MILKWSQFIIIIIFIFIIIIIKIIHPCFDQTRIYSEDYLLNTHTHQLKAHIYIYIYKATHRSTLDI